MNVLQLRGRAVLTHAHLRDGGQLLQPPDLHEHPEPDKAVLAEDRPKRLDLGCIPPAPGVIRTSAYGAREPAGNVGICCARAWARGL